jgi:hypothetical protein
MADPDFIAALEAVWRIPRPGPNNLMTAPAFTALSQLCESRFGADAGAARFALSAALRSLGLPCGLPAKAAGLALDPANAADALEAAFRRKTAVRRHLCPLDLAEELPRLEFGRSRVGQFTAEELALQFDAPRLARNFPTTPLDVQRLAQFHWLIVEEEVDLDPRPEARSVPVLFMDMGRDFGEIDPHLGRFPSAVEGALFFLLLAPWEDWSTMLEVDWRGFRLPWIYTVDEDLFARPNPPPSPDSLSLEPWIVQDAWGEEVELERPTTLRLDDDSQPGLAKFTDDAWKELEAARATPLFETPIAHFLTRGFLADGMDEIMAHMTAIEAAVGLEADHKKWLLPKGAPHRKLSATDRVAARIAAALNDPQSVRAYKDLFELRSASVHGRAGLQKVSTLQWVSARRLARGVARALVNVAAQPARLRADVMADLLDAGVQFL